jgi:hypothetical protein
MRGKPYSTAERRRGTIAKGEGPAAGIGRRSGRRPQFHRETTGQILGSLTYEGVFATLRKRLKGARLLADSLVGPLGRSRRRKAVSGIEGIVLQNHFEP